MEHIIRFEFIRYASTNEQRYSFEKFLTQTFGSNQVERSSETKKLYAVAENIALIIARTENTKIELGDCLITAHMALFGSDLLIATQNHHDFPPCLFDRMYIHMIEVKENHKLKVVGVYRFNKENYTKLSLELLKNSDPFCAQDQT